MPLSPTFCAALVHQSACRLFMFRDLLLWIIYGKIVTSVICAGKKGHDKWSDIKGCIENGQKTFFNWITNILILCYPSKQALTLSISSVKLTIDRRIVSLVILAWRLSSVGNFMEFMEILSPSYPAYLGFVPVFTVTSSHRDREYLIDLLNTEIICEWHSQCDIYKSV